MATKKTNQNNTTKATEQAKPSLVERAKGAALDTINSAAKVLTIIDVIARIALGVTVWFIAVPTFVVYAATFLGVVGALQTLHMLWKAQR